MLSRLRSTQYASTPVAHPSQAQNRRSELVALAVFPLFALLLCFPILQGKVPIAADTLYLWAPWSQLPHAPVHNAVLADSSLLSLSWATSIRRALEGGEWPLWDPYTFAGYPFAANTQNQLYYPLTWLFWLLPLSGAFQMLALSNITLAGWGMYAFARSLGTSRLAAVVAGLAFAGSGMAQLSIEIPGVATPYVWLPWMLFTTEQALRLRSAGWTAAAVLTSGLQLVAGNLQWALYSYLAVGCWVLWRAVGMSARKRIGRGPLAGGRLLSAVDPLARGAIILAGGVALAAIHLSPFLEMVGQATRASGQVSSHSAPLYEMMRIVMPEYFSTAVPGVGPPLVFNDLWYVGLLPLLLAVAAVVLRPRPAVWFWAGMALLAVFVTYGVGPFFYVRFLPVLRAILPARTGYLFIAALAVLAALGCDALLRLAAVHLRRALLLVALLALLVAGVLVVAWVAQMTEPDAALRGVKATALWRGSAFGTLAVGVILLLSIAASPWLTRVRGKSLWVGSALVALLVGDLLTAVPGYNSFVDPDRLTPSAPSISWLQSRQGSMARLMGVDSPVPSFVPNVQSLYGLYSVNGYDSLHLASYEQFWGAIDPSIQASVRGNPYGNVFIRPQVYTSTQAILLGARYIASTGPLPTTAGLTRVYTGEISIYDNPSALPRAFLVERAHLISRDEMNARLARAFNPRQEVWLEEPAPELTTAISATGEPGSVAITQYRHNSVTLQATLNSAAWLVLADPNYPGWRATVDGHDQKVYTAYGLLRAVPLSAGQHVVVFSYAPGWLLPAGLVSAVMLLAVVLVMGRRLTLVLRGNGKAVSTENLP